MDHLLEVELAGLRPFTADFLADPGAIRGEVERDEIVAIRPLRRAEGELVVVPGHPEAVEDRFVVIRDAVAVAVLDAGQLGALHHDEGGRRLRDDAERLLKSLRELLPGFPCRFEDHQLPAVEDRGDPAIRQSGDPADLGVHSRGIRHPLDLEFRRGGGDGEEGREVREVPYHFQR